MRSRFALMTAVAALGVTAAGCGGKSASTDAATAAPKTVTVDFGEYFYKPKALTLHAGDSARFVNVGKIDHTVADSSAAGDILSKLIKPRPLGHGESQTVKFTKKGTIHYLCTFHPTLMTGVIVVS